MEVKGCLLLLLSVVVLTYSSVETKAAIAKTTHLPSFNRSSFPAGFIFGASSASYQYEGAAKEGGKGPSIWDTFTHKYPGKIRDGSNGDVAVDFYHRYKEDVALMKYLGFEGFRFSISWPRLLPRGKLSGGVNREGVAFYNNLINELLAKGIKPFVTLFHWDLAQALEDEYGGFLSPHIVQDFQDFAELCFKEFGDRVKHWMTMNEPWIFVQDGYEKGVKAPGRCSPWKSNNCPAGNSGTEPYVAGHHMLLCHAASVKLYKEKYQASQKGQIGIALVTHWMVPYSNTKSDLEATQRALDFMYGWFFHPIVYGDYPRIMHTLVGKRLPKFTPEQSMLLKGSYDFIGLNYYTANYAANAPFFSRVNLSSSTDFHINLTTERNGIPIGPRVHFWRKHVKKKTWIQITSTDVSAFCYHPKGLHDLLVYTKERYNNPTIYITENGMGEANNRTTMEGVKDALRIKFYHDHLLAVHRAIKEGVKVKGFLAWSFLDNFEWNSGYTVRFGINYVDYKDGQKRYPKQSAFWFKKFLLK